MLLQATHQHKLQFERAYSFLMPKLEQGLPAYLTYHNTTHTIYVLNAAMHLAKAEKVSEQEMELVAIAALFHDAGFLEVYKNHEEASCKIAIEHLPNFSYSPEQIDEICKMIMATKLPQTPHDHLSEILCDADLFYFGTEDYFPIAENLYKEYKHVGMVQNRQEWHVMQTNFLKSHKYFTRSATKECTPKKKEHLKQLKQNLL